MSLRSPLLALLAFAAATLGQADTAAVPTVEQILAGYTAARGGAEQWARLTSMGWTGHIDEGDGKPPMLFQMLFQRPNAQRFEVIGNNQRSVRIFDGTQGWKMHPGGELGIEVQDYGPEEIAAARDACGLDGPLSDIAAKGVQVALDGAELVGQRRAWKLRVTVPSGSVQTHWIDAENYHELRYDRMTHSAGDTQRVVSVYLNNYQTIEGITLPLEIETRGANGSMRLLIEKVAFNPTLQANAFHRPEVPGTRKRGVLVNVPDARAEQAPRH